MNDRRSSLMTLEAIRAAGDGEVEQAIVDSVVQHLGTDATQHYDIAAQMPTGFQVVFSTWVLEGEVENGGFLQYFYNTRANFAEQGLEALKTLGAAAHAAVLEAALSRLNDEIPELAPYWRQGNS